MSLAKTFFAASAEPALPRHAAFVLRVTLGATLLAHGLLKVLVFGLAGTSGFFASLGFAEWLVYPVIAVEVLGGVLLLLGLWVRPVAILAAVLLAVTVFVHAPNGWLFSAANGGWEYPLFLTLSAIVVALAGEGAYALHLPARSAATPPQTPAAAAA